MKTQYDPPLTILAELKAMEADIQQGRLNWRRCFRRGGSRTAPTRPDRHHQNEVRSTQTPPSVYPAQALGLHTRRGLLCDDLRSGV